MPRICRRRRHDRLDPLALIGLAILGLAVGSFLNVCIHRLPRKASIVQPASRCPHCGYVLRWSDNVPVLSYAVARRRVPQVQGRHLDPLSRSSSS